MIILWSATPSVIHNLRFRDLVLNFRISSTKKHGEEQLASETKFKEDKTRLIPEEMDTNANSKPWPVVEVQEVCDLIVDCVNKTAPTVDHITPYKMIRTANIRSGKIDLTACRYVEADTYERWTRRAKVKAGDVLLTREAPIGEVGYVSCDDTTFLGQRIMQYRANPKVLDSRYLHYSFLSPALRYQFGVHEGSGSVVSHIRVGDCYKFKIPLPPLEEQAVIANILGTLDDKIDLNNQMNKTLEQIAQTLFKRWFIDFEFPDENGNPYKSSGGRMVDSELGEIPEGWEVKEVNEILELAYGKSLKEDTRLPGNVLVYGSNGQVGWHNQKLVDGPGIVVGRKGNPGTVNWVHTHFYPIDTTFYVIPKAPVKSLYYILYALKKQDLPSLAADSAVPGLNRNMVYMNKMIVPEIDVLGLFDVYLNEIYQKIQANEEQSRVLGSIRDSLLPKLMSGKIRVNL